MSANMVLDRSAPNIRGAPDKSPNRIPLLKKYVLSPYLDNDKVMNERR